jgi:hypothetical protein
VKSLRPSRGDIIIRQGGECVILPQQNSTDRVKKSRVATAGSTVGQASKWSARDRWDTINCPDKQLSVVVN